MFQSTPVIANGRTRYASPQPACCRPFQSTPVIANGRTRGAGADRTPVDSFNPRPSSLTGEPDTEALEAQVIEFQSTPVIANGRTRLGWSESTLQKFQSTPVIANGRTSWAPLSWQVVVWFQSTPVIANGRTQGYQDMGPAVDVSIHARHR